MQLAADLVAQNPRNSCKSWRSTARKAPSRGFTSLSTRLSTRSARWTSSRRVRLWMSVGSEPNNGVATDGSNRSQTRKQTARRQKPLSVSPRPSPAIRTTISSGRILRSFARTPSCRSSLRVSCGRRGRERPSAHPSSPLIGIGSIEDAELAAQHGVAGIVLVSAGRRLAACLHDAY